MSTIVRSVALLHTPDSGAGSAHVDWMWSPGPGRPDDDARVLTTLRLAAPPLECGAAFTAERLHDHRARYLWFEGAIGRGLGRVERLWTGAARLLEQTGDRFDIELADGLEIVRVEGCAEVVHHPSSQTTIYRCTAHRRVADASWGFGPRTQRE